METIGGDGSKTELGMKKGEKNRRPVSVPASPRTTGRRMTTSAGNWQSLHGADL